MHTSSAVLQWFVVSTAQSFDRHVVHPTLLSFPTRRSSDLNFLKDWKQILHIGDFLVENQDIRFFHFGSHVVAVGHEVGRSEEHTSDSSHVAISYAVFCVKRKNSNLCNVFSVYARLYDP